jgi:hypothetical protein
MPTQKYKLSDGTLVPGVTTVLSELAKPALVPWAWKLGKEGIDYRTYTDNLAGIGTLAHAMVIAHLKNEKYDTNNYSANQITLSEIAFLKYLEWEKNHKLETILAEEPLVSESLRFGGCLDWYGKLDGNKTLLDFKTGKAIYDDFFPQLSAYKLLLEESGHEVSISQILRIGRDETEGFEESAKITDLSIEWNIFRGALMVYQNKKLRTKKERNIKNGKL